MLFSVSILFFYSFLSVVIKCCVFILYYTNYFLIVSFSLRETNIVQTYSPGHHFGHYFKAVVCLCFLGL